MDENKLFYGNQFAFRKQHSTCHAIIIIVEKVSKALDTGKMVVGVFLDLKNAFDTVDHTILLRKLQSYGIHGNVHAWLYNYLNNRSQYVHFNDYNSDINTLLMGSPKDLYWSLCCSLFTLMTSPEPQIYCFQYYLLMTQAFSLKAQTITKLLIF